MDADNGQDNRVTDFVLIREGSSHMSSLVLTLDGAVPSGHADIFCSLPCKVFRMRKHAH